MDVPPSAPALEATLALIDSLIDVTERSLHALETGVIEPLGPRQISNGRELLAAMRAVRSSFALAAREVQGAVDQSRLAAAPDRAQ